MNKNEKNYKHLAKMILNNHVNTICWIEHHCDDSDFNLIHKELDTNFDEEWMNCDTWLEQIIDNIDEYVDSPYYFSVIEPIVFGDVESSKDEENNKCCPTCWREVGAWYIPWVLCESWCFGLYDDSKDE